MSLSSKLVFDCVLFITATFNFTSQCLCTKENTLPARRLPRARHPRASSFFRNFSKNSDNFVETNRTSERFFKRELKLSKGKNDGLRGMASRYSFKAPSANTSAATTRRLASTSLVSSFHPTSFQESSSDCQDSGSKRCIHEAKSWLSYLPNLSSSRGGCEWMAALSGLKGPGLTTLTPPRLQSTT
jgi:hypothetical protein